MDDIETRARRLRAVYVALGSSPSTHEWAIVRYNEALTEAASFDSAIQGSWGWWANHIAVPAGRCATCRWSEASVAGMDEAVRTLVCLRVGGDSLWTNDAQDSRFYDPGPADLACVVLSESGNLRVSPDFGRVMHEAKEGLSSYDAAVQNAKQRVLEGTATELCHELAGPNVTPATLALRRALNRKEAKPDA